MAILSVGFQGTVQWIFHHGYPLIFLLMLIEGPVVTAAAAFAAALGYANVWIIILLSLFSNLLPDAIYYAIGYWGRSTFIDRYGHYIGITPERMAMTEELTKDHSGKSIFMIKMVPLLATPGLIAIGAARMNLRAYAWWCTIIAIPSTLIYFILGYYFGAAYTTIDHYLHLGIYVAIAAVIITVGIVYFQRKYFERMLVAKKNNYSAKFYNKYPNAHRHFFRQLLS